MASLLRLKDITHLQTWTITLIGYKDPDAWPLSCHLDQQQKNTLSALEHRGSIHRPSLKEFVTILVLLILCDQFVSPRSGSFRFRSQRLSNDC